jgi:hypothetical protein
VSWATHLLGGVVSPSTASSSESELVYQLTQSGAKCIFTCPSHLNLALVAAEKAKIDQRHVYLLETPAMVGEAGNFARNSKVKTVEKLVQQGERLKAIESLRWRPGQGAQQAYAFQAVSLAFRYVFDDLVLCPNAMTKN